MKRKVFAIVMAIVLLFTGMAMGEMDQSPEITPFGELDKTLTELPKPENYEEIVARDNGGQVSITCPGEAKIFLSTGEIDFWYEQSWLSSHDAMIQLVLTDEAGNETLVAQSGIIPKGYRMNSMELLSPLEVGKYKATVLLYFFSNVSLGIGICTDLPVILNVAE